MTAKCRQRNRDRWLAEREKFADSLISDFKINFPEAISWVVFSFVKEQKKVGIGKSSNRLEEMEMFWDRFRENESVIPKHSPLDIICTDSIDRLREYLIDLYDDHEYGVGPLCCMHDSDNEALVAYEYFWTE